MHNQTKQNLLVESPHDTTDNANGQATRNLHAITPGSDNERLAIAIFGEDWRERLQKNGNL